MQKKALTEINLYSGHILMPDGFEINRTQIKHDIIASFSTNKRMSDNIKDWVIENKENIFNMKITLNEILKM